MQPLCFIPHLRMMEGRGRILPKPHVAAKEAKTLLSTEMGAIKTALTPDQTDGILEDLGMERNITTAVYHLWDIHILNTQCWQFPTSKMYNWKGSEEDQRCGKASFCAKNNSVDFSMGKRVTAEQHRGGLEDSV